MVSHSLDLQKNNKCQYYMYEIQLFVAKFKLKKDLKFILYIYIYILLEYYEIYIYLL